MLGKNLAERDRSRRLEINGCEVAPRLARSVLRSLLNVRLPYEHLYNIAANCYDPVRSTVSHGLRIWWGGDVSDVELACGRLPRPENVGRRRVRRGTVCRAR